MLDKIKKKIQVEGIDCNKCLTNIKKEVNLIKGCNCTINYHKKTLNLDIEKAKDINQVLTMVNLIANKHEHHILIREKVIENTIKKTLKLDNLGCANCAAKMERQIKNIEGVTDAYIDFVGKKLTLEVANSKDLKKIIEQAKTIVSKIETTCSIVDEDDVKGVEIEEEEEDFKLKISILGIGGLLYIIGLVFKFAFPAWLEFLVMIISFLIVGGEVILRAIKNIIHGQIFDENLLMTIATIGAFGIGEFSEGVAVMLFYQIGELFQDIAVDKSRKSISKLMDIRPEYANLKVLGGLKKVGPSEVEIGDVIVVKPGEKVPLDGKIIEGNSFVDTTALTGESTLREVNVGNDVLSGFINQNSVLTIEVTKNYGDSAVSLILDLVENASSRKANTENFITKFAKYYTPSVVIAALLIAFVPSLVFHNATLGEWVSRALVFLVISCPCALVLSIPLGFFGGIGGASKNGILIKGSNYLEALNSVDTVVFDKTGTLTKGVFNVTSINPTKDYSSDDVLMYAAYAESFSNHPIAHSIIRFFNKEIDKNKITKYEEISGKGIKVQLGEDTILAGNSKLMEAENIQYTVNDSYGTIVYIAVNNKYIGNVIISDEIKLDAKEAIKAMKASGIRKTVMLTGDSKKVAESVGKELGVDVIYSELLPHQKVEKLEELEMKKSPKGKIIFVGDGINDAPVLARADVGVAMGGLGSDAAIEAADIVIMTDEPSKITTAVRIARRTRKIVWENIYFSLGVKLLFLVFGAMGLASMWHAVFADVGVSLIAVLNAMRVLKYKKL